mmetsp:Transcript_90421/g.281515  ORF Transcript_90421/g.281515 Transcript_90421/m.281515 type:complete len:359 (-) Transcript_90421:248-1324(-)
MGRGGERQRRLGHCRHNGRRGAPGGIPRPSLWRALARAPEPGRGAAAPGPTPARGTAEPRPRRSLSLPCGGRGGRGGLGAEAPHDGPAACGGRRIWQLAQERAGRRPGAAAPCIPWAAGVGNTHVRRPGAAPFVLAGRAPSPLRRRVELEVIAVRLLKAHHQVGRLLAFGANVPAIMLVKILQQVCNPAHCPIVGSIVAAAHMELQRKVGLLRFRTLEEAAPNAPEPYLCTALFADAAHSVSPFPKDALHQAELVVVLDAKLEDAHKPLVVAGGVALRSDESWRGGRRRLPGLAPRAPRGLGRGGGAVGGPTRTTIRAGPLCGLAGGGHVIRQLCYAPRLVWPRGRAAEDEVVIVQLL